MAQAGCAVGRGPASTRAGCDGTGHPARPLGRASALQAGRRGPLFVRGVLSGVWLPWKTRARATLCLSFLICRMGTVVSSGGAEHVVCGSRQSGAGAGHARSRRCRQGQHWRWWLAVGGLWNKPPGRVWLLGSSLPATPPQSWCRRHGARVRDSQDCQFLGLLSCPLKPSCESVIK